MGVPPAAAGGDMAVVGVDNCPGVGARVALWACAERLRRRENRHDLSGLSSGPALGPAQNTQELPGPGWS